MAAGALKKQAVATARITRSRRQYNVNLFFRDCPSCGVELSL